MKSTFLYILLTISLLACQSEPKEQPEETPEVTEKAVTEKPTAPSSNAVGKMVRIEDGKLMLDNTEAIELDSDDATTVFLLRHAETMQGKTSLSGVGRNRTGRVGELFLGKDLSQVYADGNASMQTGLAAAKGSEDVPFGLIKMDGTESFAKTLTTNFKGKRVLMAMTEENLEVLLQQLSGQDVDIPTEEFDNLFIVKVRELGDADVTHLKY